MPKMDHGELNAAIDKLTVGGEITASYPGKYDATCARTAARGHAERINVRLFISKRDKVLRIRRTA